MKSVLRLFALAACLVAAPTYSAMEVAGVEMEHDADRRPVRHAQRRRPAHPPDDQGLCNGPLSAEEGGLGGRGDRQRRGRSVCMS